MKLVLHQLPSRTMSMVAISLCILQATGFTTEWRQSSTTFHYKTSNARRRTILDMSKKVGIFFGTSTGSTESAAYEIMEAFGDDCPDPPIEIDSLQGKVAKIFEEYDSLIVGTPTWNTGADTERSGTGWDEIYYGEMQDLNIKDKKVAVFGLGDSVSYAENYADASGELHDVFEKLGCKLYGYTSQDGYEHEDSKAIRGDKFCGLLLDAVNQEELTGERVQNWVAQLISEGFLDSGSDNAVQSTPTIDTTSTASSTVDTQSISSKLEELENENAKLRDLLEKNSNLLEESIMAHAEKQSVGEDGFTPHYNPKNGRTMWTSADGKTCYYTSVERKTNTFQP